MGLSLPHLLIVALVVLVLFGRGRISEMMGDFGKGIKSFKQGMADEEPTRQAPPPVQIPPAAAPCRAGFAADERPASALSGKRFNLMFDIGADELLLTAVVAIVVIGPKDLPRAMRVAGKWVAKMRRMSNAFRSGFENIVREAEMEEMEREWKERNAAIMAAHPTVTADDDATAAAAAAQGEALAIEHQPAPADAYSDPHLPSDVTHDAVIGASSHGVEAEPAAPHREGA